MAVIIIIARSASYVRGCSQTDVSVRSVRFVRKIIDFCEGYMNPGHVQQSIGTLQTWFFQMLRKVKLRLKAGLFGDPVLTLFFENRYKNVPVVIIVSPAWKWPSSECRSCDVSTTYSSCLLMKWQCRRFAHPCPALKNPWDWYKEFNENLHDYEFLCKFSAKLSAKFKCTQEFLCNLRNFLCTISHVYT